jgi:opacity protein-like surface antigen
MTMCKSVVLSLVLFCFCNIALAQSSEKIALEIQVGAGSFTPFSDFQETIYKEGDRDFNRFNGNVTESDVTPALSIGLQVQLNDRWQLAPFIQYQSGDGVLNENEISTFGVSATVPVEQVFRSSSANNIKALTGGVELRYRLASLAKTQLYFGTGIAYTLRSHNYRNELEVDFNEDRTTSGIVEGFTTEDKSAASIPVSISLEQGLSDRVSLTLNARGLIVIGLEDRAWTAGIGVRYKL